jgi:hypothetical protein
VRAKSVRVASRFGIGPPRKRGLFALATLAAWTGAASLLVVLKLAPLTRGEPLTIYSTALFVLLPWLAGLVYWRKLGKMEKLGALDRDDAGFCYRIVFTCVVAAYGAMAPLVGVLISALFRGR